MKKKYRFRSIVSVLSVSLIVLLILIRIFLPSLAGKFIASRLVEQGLVRPAFTVRHAGLTRLDITDIIFGDASPHGLSIHSLAADYSLGGLFKGRINRIDISGLRLRVSHNGERFGFPQILAGDGADVSGGIDPPVSVFTIQNSAIDLIRGQSQTMIPFELTARRDADGRWALSSRIYPYGNAVTVNGRLDPKSGKGELSLQAEALRLKDFLDELGGIPYLFLENPVAVDAQIRLDRWGLTAAQVRLRSEALRVRHPLVGLRGRLTLAFRAEADWIPRDLDLRADFSEFYLGNIHIGDSFAMRVSGPESSDLRFDLAGAGLTLGPGLYLRHFSGHICGVPEKPVVQGRYVLKLDPSIFQSLAEGISMSRPFDLEGDFMVDLGAGTPRWTLSGKSGRIGPLTLADGGITMRTLLVHMNIAGDGTRQSGRVTMKIPEMRGRKDLVSGKEGWVARGIALEAPFDRIHPAPLAARKRIPAGDFSVDHFAVAGVEMRSVQGKIWGRDDSLRFDMTVPIPGGGEVVSISGRADLGENGPRVEADITLAEIDLSKIQIPGEMVPVLGEARTTGTVSGHGRFVLAGDTPQFPFAVRIRDATISLPGEGVSLNGLNGYIRMEDLLNPRSQKAQRLSFSKMISNGITLSDGQVIFAIEKDRTLFLQEVSFSVFDGRILINPLRITPGLDEIRLKLYCDRVNFDQILNFLLEEAVASGKVELNGIITLTLKGGTAVFEDSYLYTTPGVKGNIRFTKGEIISGGVLIVEEAVKDFNYDWIKVNIYSNKSLLNVVAFINGIPANKLPLTYDTKEKNIVRDKEGRRLLDLKGLLLELRFSDIDLKQVLRTGSKIYVQQKNKE